MNFIKKKSNQGNLDLIGFQNIKSNDNVKQGKMTPTSKN